MAAGLPPELTSRREAERVLDIVCAYFERYEPSSPVPLLLRRAKGLISKNFVEIIRDVVPSGLKEAEGLEGSDKKGSK